MIRPRPRVLLGLPIVLLATGCAMEPYDQVQSPVAPPAPVARVIMTLPALHDAASKWELADADPWSPYVKLTLLSALDASPRKAEVPDVASLDVVARAERAAQSIAADGLPEDAMWVVDLRGAASVAFGAALSHRSARRISPVITFNNWPAEREVVPAEETLAALCTFEPRAPLSDTDSTLGEPTIPVFLLDSWRLAYRDEEPGDDLTDNRYMLTESDLPSADVLRAQGIRRVVYVVEQFEGGTVEEDDLNATFLAYQRAGIAIHIVDLGWLTRGMREPEVAESWLADLPSVTFYVEPRSTVVVDPDFYRRSQGGFGGVHGGPMVMGRSEGYGIASPHVGGRSDVAASPHFGGHGGG